MRRSKKFDEASVLFQPAQNSSSHSAASSLRSIGEAMTRKDGVDASGLTRPPKKIKATFSKRRPLMFMRLTWRRKDANARSSDEDLNAELQKLKQGWRSEIYTFFDTDHVVVQWVDGRLCHFFPCASPKCKTKTGGVRRFQDSQDKGSTSNLRTHAVGCFGEEAVRMARPNKSAPDLSTNGSTHAAIARKDQEPVTDSHREHTNLEVRARIVQWVTESNRPVDIIKRSCAARSPHCLAAHPFHLPSESTISRDIESSV
ncbi:hypothetical protein HD554DRAFT_1599377 [Boletus coccyginus]|nr:hypothetical protein HD554DRAFT_1599377 [Boletus coccyginus]